LIDTNKLDLKVNEWVERDWRSVYGLFSVCQGVLRLIYGPWAGLTAALKDYLDRNLKDCLGGVSYVFPFTLVYVSFMFYGSIGALTEAIRI
jgi:hypothetical protein